MNCKTFTLAAIFVVSQAVKIETSQEQAMPTPEEVLAAFGNSGRLNRREWSNAVWTYFPDLSWNDVNDAFDAADTDNDKLVDIDELTEVFRRLADGEPLVPVIDFTWLFDLYDRNQDGELNKAEAAYAYFDHNPEGNGTEFENVWSALDWDEDGQLDSEELEELKYFDIFKSLAQTDRTTSDLAWLRKMAQLQPPSKEEVERAVERAMAKYNRKLAQSERNRIGVAQLSKQKDQEPTRKEIERAMKSGSWSVSDPQSRKLAQQRKGRPYL